MPNKKKKNTHTLVLKRKFETHEKGLQRDFYLKFQEMRNIKNKL